MASTSEEQKEADRAQRDLVSYATSVTTDLYALLDLPSPSPSSSADPTALAPAPAPAPTDADLNKAWRKAALKHHPDKNRGDEPAAADRLDAARRAWQVLKDPAARAAYDAKRRAEVDRRLRENALEGRRRGLAEALRRGEEAAGSPGGVKRGFGGVSGGAGGSGGAVGEKEAKVRRLEEEGRRRRVEFQEAARRRREEEEGRAQASGPEQSGTPTATATVTGHGSTGHGSAGAEQSAQVAELDRTVKIRWPRGSAVGDGITPDTLAGLFKRFGAVESAVVLKDKKARPSMGGSPVSSPTLLGEKEKEKKGKKQVMGSGIVVFESIVAAHAAVLDAMRITSKAQAKSEDVAPEWTILDSVDWAAGQAPDLGFESSSSSRPSLSQGEAGPTKSSDDPFVESNSTTASTSTAAKEFTPRRPFPGLSSSGTPSKTPSALKGNGTPSFSFGANKLKEAGANGSPRAGGGPSNYEVTMMRLKEAERRRLEEKIRREEAQAE